MDGIRQTIRKCEIVKIILCHDNKTRQKPLKGICVRDSIEYIFLNDKDGILSRFTLVQE